MTETMRMAFLLDRGAGDHRADRYAPAERFREHEEIRHYAVDLEAIHPPEPAKAGLALVEHHQHAALTRQVHEPGEVTGRRHDHASGGKHRLGDHRGGRADRRLVEEVEARFETGAVAGAVAVTDRAAVRIGCRECESAG